VFRTATAHITDLLIENVDQWIMALSFCGLFYGGVSHETVERRMVGWIGKDFHGSGCGAIEIFRNLKSIIFWDMTPCSLLSSNRRLGGTYRLHLQDRRTLLVLAKIISSTLKMEAIYSSETSVATQQTTRRLIPEDDTLHNHRCENLKSYIPKFAWSLSFRKARQILLRSTSVRNE
jgi:hypothetical protein